MIRALVVAGVATNLIAAAVTSTAPEWSLVGPQPAARWFALASGLAVVVAAAVYAAERRGDRAALLLGAAAALWPLAEWASPAAPAVVFTIGLGAGTSAPAVLAHALMHLQPQRDRLRIARTAAIAAGYAGLVALAGVAAALVADPRAAGCSDCPENLLLITAEAGTASFFERWGTWLGVAGVGAAALIGVARLVRGTPAARRAAAPLVLPGAVFLAVVVAAGIHDEIRGWDAADEQLRLAEAGALLALAGGVAWRRLSRRRLRGRVAALVLEIARVSPRRALREMLADELGDPGLELLYAYEDGWIDADGTRRALTGSREVTSLVQEGEVVAVLVHAPGVLDDPRLVDELGRAARLAIDHERLQAQQRAQFERLRAARTEIVAAADGERRRLERDLHDGAQQALASLAMAIGLERSGATEAEAERLATAQDLVRSALDRVRTIAHATYPAALDDAGLAAALEVLAEWRPNVEVAALPEVAPELETGVYFIVAALTGADAGDAVVELRQVDDRLVIDVSRAADAGLGDAEDRAGALGGAVSVADEGRRVRVELACA